MYSRDTEFYFSFSPGSWLWLFRSLQMKRAQSVAEGPSINNKQQLSCVQPSVSSGTQSQVQHLRGVCFSFRLWSCLFQWFIKVCMRVSMGVCVCLHSLCRASVYYILNLAGSKKSELRVVGARKRGLPAHCRTAGSSPKSQLPGTGWDFQASARLPLWSRARKSWRKK